MILRTNKLEHFTSSVRSCRMPKSTCTSIYSRTRSEERADKASLQQHRTRIRSSACHRFSGRVPNPIDRYKRPVSRKSTRENSPGNGFPTSAHTPNLVSFPTAKRSGVSGAARVSQAANSHWQRAPPDAQAKLQLPSFPQRGCKWLLKEAVPACKEQKHQLIREKSWREAASCRLPEGTAKDAGGFR